MKVIINMNEEVKVRLTEYGKQILRDNYKKLMIGTSFEFKYTEPKIDEEGYSKFQLWVLFQEFGEHIQMGFKPLFENDLIFEKQL